MASVIAYVDGFNLYHGMHSKYGRRYLWLDLVRLVQQIRPRDRIVAVRYFTARVLDDPPALARQHTYLGALTARHGNAIDLVMGRHQRKTRECAQCGYRKHTYEEKETDVNIAVSLVADTAARASDIALIVSADSDLCPAIRAARAVDTGRGMIAAFPPRRSSFEVKSLIKGAFTISTKDIRNSQLPPTVIDRTTGSAFKRPAYWS